MTVLLKGDFARLWLASGMSTLGDGVTIAAGPLLMASISSDPAVVAGAAFAQQLPWLLFSLVSGVLVDRVDRRMVVGAVGVMRAVVMGGLALLVWQGWANVPIVYAAVFLLGVGATLSDNAGQALLPSVVADGDLPKANAGLSGIRMVCNQFAGPPLGGWLFAVAAAVPFGMDAACFALGALLMFSLPRRGTGGSDTAPAEPARRGSIRKEMAEGLRWLWNHNALRTLAVTMGLMNVTYGGTYATYVLYSRERLGLTEVGYGFLLAATAVGGVVGTLAVARLEARFGSAALLRFGLITETLTHLVLAATRLPWVAAITLVVFGAHASIWGVIGVTLRQRVTPAEMLGRVNSVCLLFSMGGYAVGALLGGFVARTLGITGPFWVAFAAMCVLTPVVWRHMTPTALAPETKKPGTPSHPTPTSGQ
ncbi:MFS transporter [Streptomyces sp. NPDC007905]|uniref:MFS transporter n=1 Tax=Streptomyces sp. NPDC007905 TaxID=3364788 RepID=UPI0036E7BC52